MPAVADTTSATSHGGAAWGTYSPNVLANRNSVIRLGDTYDCPIHGANPTVSASTTVEANSKGLCRVGDACACGAVISSGSPNVNAG